jgi:hypothetical protein
MRSLVSPFLAPTLLAATFVGSSQSLWAAEITDVADAADEVVVGTTTRAKAWDMYLTVSSEIYSTNGKITREPLSRPGVSFPVGCSAAAYRDCAPLDELRYSRTTTVTRFDAEFGLYQDFSLTLGWGTVMADNLRFRYASGVSAATSSIDPQGAQDLNSDGVADSRDTLVSNDFHTWHGGIFTQAGSLPLDIGMRFAPLNDERDNSKPNWVLFAKMAVPWTTKTNNPVTPTTSSHPGSVGDGMYWLTFGTALSKRLGEFGLIGIDPNINRRGYVDPYMEFSFATPLAAGGSPKFAALRANDPNKSGGRLPSRIGRLKAGVELVPYEDLQAGRKVSFNLGLNTAYFSSGRNYSEVTDALQTLTFTDAYLSVTGIVGLYLQLSHYFKIKAAFLAGYNTDHWLTDESPGDGNNNPYFCPANGLCGLNGLQYNQVGHRLRDQEHVTLGGNFALQFLF